VLHNIYEFILNQNTNIFEGPEISEKVIPPKKPPTKVVPRKEPPAKGILLVKNYLPRFLAPWLYYKFAFYVIFFFCVLCLGNF
jgi:hypothetical protein